MHNLYKQAINEFDFSLSYRPNAKKHAVHLLRVLEKSLVIGFLCFQTYQLLPEGFFGYFHQLIDLFESNYRGLLS